MGVVTVYNDMVFCYCPVHLQQHPEPPKSDTKNQATREATVPNENTAAPAPTAAEAVSAPMQTSHDPMRDFEKAEEGFTVPEQATDDESSFCKTYPGFFYRINNKRWACPSCFYFLVQLRTCV